MRSKHPSLNRKRPAWGAVRGAAIFFLAVWFGRAAEPVVLQLRNGDRLTGSIIQEETNQITFKTTWYNVVVIPATEIKAREKVSAEAPVLPPPATLKPPSAPVQGAPGTTAAILPISPIGLIPPAPRHRFSGEAQVGTDLMFSERNRQLVSGRLKLVHSYDRLRNNFDYLFWYGRTDGVLSDNRMSGSLKTDYDLPRRFYVYNLGGAGYDQIRNIDRRFEIGPGLGYHLIKRTNVVLNVELGGNYQAQYYADGSDLRSYYLRSAESLTWQILPRLSVDEKFEFSPNAQRWSAYQMRLEGNLNYAVLSHLSLVLTVLDEYDTQTADGVGQNDLQIRSSLSVKF